MRARTFITERAGRIVHKPGRSTRSMMVGAGLVPARVIPIRSTRSMMVGAGLVPARVIPIRSTRSMMVGAGLVLTQATPARFPRLMMIIPVFHARSKGIVHIAREDNNALQFADGLEETLEGAPFQRPRLTIIGIIIAHAPAAPEL